VELNIELKLPPNPLNLDFGLNLKVCEEDLAVKNSPGLGQKNPILFV